MAVSTTFPQKRSLFSSLSQSQYSLSIPFALQSSFSCENNPALSADISFPWSFGVAGVEISSVGIDSDIKDCNLLAQLLDNSGRVVSTPFPVARMSESIMFVKTCIGLHEFQKIRFFLINADLTASGSVTVLGKVFLLSGGTTCSKALRRQMTKWQRRKIDFKAYSHIKVKKIS